MTMADRTKIVRGLLSLSLVAALPAMADQKAPAYEMTADGVVQIAPDGHVSDYRLNDGLSPTIAELVRKSVMGWRFEPVVVDGRAVVAKTAMQIQLSAEPAAGKADEFVVRVTEVKFGSPKRAGGRPPHYPEQAAHARVERVEVRLRRRALLEQRFGDRAQSRYRGDAQLRAGCECAHRDHAE